MSLIKQKIIDSAVEVLIRSGFKSLALYLLTCKLYVSQNGQHYTDCQKNIYIDMSQISSIEHFIFLVKHEMLHNLLYHLQRVKKIKDKSNINIKLDLEISNYYTHADNILNSCLGGLSVSRTEFSQFKGLAFEDIELDASKFPPDGIDITGLMNIEIPETKPSEKEMQIINDTLKDLKKAIDEEQKNNRILAAASTAEPDALQKLYYSLNRYFMKYGKLNRKRTFAKPPRKQLDSSIIFKGVKRKPSLTKSLAIYIDCSGSFSMEGKIRKSLQILENTKRLKGVNIITKYFNECISKKPLNAAGNNNYNLMLNDIIKNKYSCVAVISDSDEYSINTPEVSTLEACWIVAVHCAQTYVGQYLPAALKTEISI